MTLWLSRILSWGSLVTESILPVMLLAPLQKVSARRVAIVCIIGLHLGFQLLHQPGDVLVRDDRLHAVPADRGGLGGVGALRAAAQAAPHRLLRCGVRRLLPDRPTVGAPRSAWVASRSGPAPIWPRRPSPAAASSRRCFARAARAHDRGRRRGERQDATCARTRSPRSCALSRPGGCGRCRCGCPGCARSPTGATICSRAGARRSRCGWGSRRAACPRGRAPTARRRCRVAGRAGADRARSRRRSPRRRPHGAPARSRRPSGRVASRCAVVEPRRLGAICGHAAARAAPPSCRPGPARRSSSSVRSLLWACARGRCSR